MSTVIFKYTIPNATRNLNDGLTLNLSTNFVKSGDTESIKNITSITCSYPVMASSHISSAKFSTRLYNGNSTYLTPIVTKTLNSDGGYVATITNTFNVLPNNNFFIDLTKISVYLKQNDAEVNDVNLRYKSGSTYYVTITVNYEGGSGTPYVWKTSPKEYSFPETPMTENYSSNCIALASSTYDSDRQPYWCFDLSNQTTAWWSSNNATGPWVQLIMPRALYNIEVTLTNRDVDYARGLKTGYIYGSDIETPLIEITGRDGDTANLSTVHQCNNNTVAHNSVRVKFTDWGKNSSGTRNFAAMGEIRIKGYDIPTGGGWIEATPYVFVSGEWT